MEDLKKYTLPELRAMSKDMGVKGYSKLKKGAIITRLSKEISRSGRTPRGVRQDAQRKAMPPGRRVSAAGNVYYESRPNRSDVRPGQQMMLMDGGYNGYSNYPTWRVAKDISENLDDYQGKTAKELRHVFMNCAYNFVDGVNTLIDDLLMYSLESVNWNEIEKVMIANAF